MIMNMYVPHVIHFKDFLYYDDINEFLKRPYKIKESKGKLEQLIEYYEKESDNVFPILPTIMQSKIILKRYGSLFHYHEKNYRLSGD